jgi:hypothetical protein
VFKNYADGEEWVLSAMSLQYKIGALEAR